MCRRVEKSQSSSDKGLMNQFVTVRLYIEQSEKIHSCELHQFVESAIIICSYTSSFVIAIPSSTNTTSRNDVSGQRHIWGTWEPLEPWEPWATCKHQLPPSPFPTFHKKCGPSWIVGRYHHFSLLTTHFSLLFFDFQSKILKTNKNIRLGIYENIIKMDLRNTAKMV